jgi:ABC-type Fe3+/spermidine/putrescine transport system ATPase subunit
MTAAIAFENVTLRYGGRDVLRGLTLAVEPGEVVALLGPSGCGKTSALRLVLGFVAPSRGNIRFGGEVVSRDGKVLRLPEQRGVGVVFQDLALWPHLTVRGNLAFGLGSRKLPRGEMDDRIRAMLGRVGLTDKERSHPGELSGGERQRVAIARALVLEPRAVLFDEPLSNLDVGLKCELLSMFRELLSEQKTTAIYVTHDLHEAATLGDRIAVMEEGHVVQEGTLDTLHARPANEFVRGLVDALRWEGAAGVPSKITRSS